MISIKPRYWPYILLALLSIIYFLSGFYSLRNGQNAIILRFGNRSKMVTTPGVHYHLPAPFEKSIRIHISNVQTVSLQERGRQVQERFTGDENLIMVQAMISYDIKNMTHYLFNIDGTRRFIQSIGQMVLTQELAKMTVDDSMTAGKSILRLAVKEKIQHILNQMAAGVRVISVELTDISPPHEVYVDFKAVSDARVKKQEIINNAEGYANASLPKARGDAASLISKARAQSKEIINSAESEAEAYNKLLVEYKKHPYIVKNQRYLDTIRTIGEQATVNIDTNPLNSTYYVNGDRTVKNVSIPTDRAPAQSEDQ